jgi:hypothetical protein
LDGGGHSTELARRMQALEKSYKSHLLKAKQNHNFIPVVTEDAEKTEEEEREKQKARIRGARNLRLMDPDMISLKDKKQANVMLQEELKQSNLRVKCVR